MLFHALGRRAILDEPHHTGEGESERAILSAKEVVLYFGVEKTTVYRWCREGRIPCMKIGKHWRVRREELVDFLERAEKSRRP